MEETFGQALRRYRGALSLRAVAALATCSKSLVGDLETGHRKPTPAIASALDKALNAGGHLIHLSAHPPGTPVLQLAAALQQDFADTIAAGPMTDASLDEWDFAVERHGRATRYRPDIELLPELIADFGDLHRVIGHRHPPAMRRRLMRNAARLAGLMALTLLKLDDKGAADWWRTGRNAAAAADDRPVLAWIYAQESYQRYYSGDMVGAVELAVRAQQLASGMPCVADALAAPLEARAHARLGRREEAADALTRGRVALDRLAPGDREPSAFGYDPGQYHFHAGNAWTHLHDTERAWEEQQQALALYAPENRLDRTLIMLDRAVCVAWDGDPAVGAQIAVHAVLDLSEEHRSALIVYRARDLATTVPASARQLPEVRVLHEVLALPSGAH